MTPVHYKAKVLPDGHLPLPEDCAAKAGEEVEVTVAPASPAPRPTSDEEVGRWQRDNVLRDLVGIANSGLTDGAERHDDYL